jgi:polyisoprenoid-binding protein YceI
MRRFAAALTLAFAALALPVAADTYAVDRDHSQVGFQIRHLLSKVRGQFDDYRGTIQFDAAAPQRSAVEFVIEAKSINTFHAKRDEHLRGSDFFDVANHPQITFRSEKVVPLGGGHFAVSGPLTLRGVTRQVTLPVEQLGPVVDPWGNTKAGFVTRLTLDRKEYGINWNAALDQGGTLLSDEVDVEIQLEAARQQPATAAR